MDRDLCAGKFLGGQPSDMTYDNDPISVDDDGLTPVILLDGRGDLVDRRLWNLAWVARIGDDPINGPYFGSHLILLFPPHGPDLLPVSRGFVLSSTVD